MQPLPLRLLSKLKAAAAQLVVIVNPEIYVHSAWHNRASAALIFLFWSFGNTFIAVWIISMRTAT